MSRDALKTLFYPFASGTVAVPGEGERILFLGAEAGFSLPDGFGAELSAVQPLRSFHRQLQAQRVAVTPVIEGEDYDGALVLSPSTRARTRRKSPKPWAASEQAA